MIYLLDANVLIDANRDYYNMDRVPEFWEWLEEQGRRDRVKIPFELHEEINSGNDALAEWAKNRSVKEALLLDEEADPALVDRTVRIGYAPDLSDDDLGKLGRDPFLVAYALVDGRARCVVTTEISKPKRKRANRTEQ